MFTTKMISSTLIISSPFISPASISASGGTFPRIIFTNCTISNILIISSWLRSPSRNTSSLTGIVNINDWLFSIYSLKPSLEVIWSSNSISPYGAFSLKLIINGSKLINIYSRN